MGERKAEVPREHGHHQEGHAGSPTTQQMRAIGRRRRDAEEKLEQHLEKARHKDDLHGGDATNQEDTGEGR